MIEMALILPILLALILGIAWVGMVQLMALRLEHAAAEGAIAGASNSGDSCGVAISRANQVYGLPLDDATCGVQGQIIEVRLTDTLHFWTPWAADFGLTRTERAVLR
jgi:Flp pilus assembly protein TadG